MQCMCMLPTYLDCNTMIKKQSECDIGDAEKLGVILDRVENFTRCDREMPLNYFDIDAVIVSFVKCLWLSGL